MIPSQQPMMLDAALAFESIIKKPKAGAKTISEVTELDWQFMRLISKLDINHACNVLMIHGVLDCLSIDLIF